MKVNKVIKILIALLAMILAISCVTPVFTNAASASVSDWQNLERFNSSHDTALDTSVTSIVGAILNVTRIIAVGVAIIMLLVLAMKYMMSAPSDRADIKKHAVVYVVGAVVLFGASGILGIIQRFASNIK